MKKHISNSCLKLFQNLKSSTTSTSNALETISKVESVAFALPASNLLILDFSKLHLAAKSCWEIFFSILICWIRLPTLICIDSFKLQLSFTISQNLSYIWSMWLSYTISKYLFYQNEEIRKEVNYRISWFVLIYKNL